MSMHVAQAFQNLLHDVFPIPLHGAEQSWVALKLLVQVQHGHFRLVGDHAGGISTVPGHVVITEVPPPVL